MLSYLATRNFTDKKCRQSFNLILQSSKPEICITLESGSAEQDEKRDKKMTNQIINVLFLCNANTTCSIIAEAVMNRLSITDAGGRFKAYSAGCYHRGMVHPLTLQLLAMNNFDPHEYRSKNWQEFAEADSPIMNFIFTLTDEVLNKPFPEFLGAPMTAHWSIPDPAAANGTNAEIHYAFADTLRMIEQRISIFVNLPIKNLDQLTLQQRITDIGSQTNN